MASFAFKKKLLSSVMAVAAGVVYSGGVNAIHLAQNGVGQVLMAPLYMADYGYKTKVAIMNSRSDVAVKARVALRSRVNSLEFDFVCYMTPSDVCRFEIVRGDDGQAYLTSTDDSILANMPTSDANYRPIFASQCATEPTAQFCKDGRLWVKITDDRLPTNQAGKVYPPFVNPVLAETDRDFAAEAHSSNPDGNEIGHIEVLGAWAAKDDIRWRPGDVQVVNGVSYYPSIRIQEAMSKVELYKIFGPLVPLEHGGEGRPQSRARLAAYSSAQNEVLAGFATGRLINGVCQIDPAAGNFDTTAAVDMFNDMNSLPCSDATGAVVNDINGSRIRSTDPSWIRLSASVEMESTTSGDRMGLTMAALTGDIWDKIPPRTHVPAYGMYSASGVVNAANSVFDYAFDGRVISNPSFDFATGRILSLGDEFGRVRAGQGDTGLFYDNIVEIENALATATASGSYESDGRNLTNLVVTFPTKYRHRSSRAVPDQLNNRVIIQRDIVERELGDVCASEFVAPIPDNIRDATNALVDAGSPNPLVADKLQSGYYYYPPFNEGPSGDVSHRITAWNDQEMRIIGASSVNPFSGYATSQGPVPTITDEVNYMWMTNWPFTSGWFRLALTAKPGCQYTGVPTLAFTHKSQLGSLGFQNSWLVPLSQAQK